MKVEKKELIIFAVVALITTFSYYGPFINNFFAYDDYKYLENFAGNFSDVLLGYNTLRIVSNLAWWPLYHLSGLDPAGYASFGIVLSATNAVLLYIFLTQLLNDKFFSFLAGLFFVFNSVGADAILWKATNSSLISLFFYLGALNAYLAYRRKNSHVYWATSIGLYLLAIFSKEEAASLPFILVLMEFIFLGGWRDKKGTALRIAPYVAVIFLYAMSNWLVFNYLLQSHSEPAKLFKFRPLHTLFSGWSVFFLSPEGTGISPTNPAIYLTAIGIFLSFFWVRDKRLLFFGFGWIFFTFLPQSLTILGQLEPRELCNSISRYLYITSIGSAIVLTAITVRFKEKFSTKIFFAIAVLVLAVYIPLNYKRAQLRGNELRVIWEPMKSFMHTVKTIMPNFPPNSYIFVTNPEYGRSFTQQALRALYKNNDINWIYDLNFIPQSGQRAFLINCTNTSNGKVNVSIIPFYGSLYQILRTGRVENWIDPLPGVLE